MYQEQFSVGDDSAEETALVYDASRFEPELSAEDRAFSRVFGIGTQQRRRPAPKVKAVRASTTLGQEALPPLDCRMRRSILARIEGTGLLMPKMKPKPSVLASQARSSGASDDDNCIVIVKAPPPSVPTRLSAVPPIPPLQQNEQTPTYRLQLSVPKKSGFISESKASESQMTPASKKPRVLDPIRKAAALKREKKAVDKKRSVRFETEEISSSHSETPSLRSEVTTSSDEDDDQSDTISSYSSSSGGAFQIHRTPEKVIIEENEPEPLTRSRQTSAERRREHE